MKKVLRYLSVVPALFMLLFIFTFSAQDGDTSGSLSFRLCHTILHFIDRIFSLDLSENELFTHAESIQFLVRKIAHITEYLLLSLSIYLPLRVLAFREPPRKTRESVFYKTLVSTFLISVICAALDEFHQSIVPGRYGTPVDVLIDSIGILLGCALLTFFNFRKKNKPNEH